jgi:ribonucleoside-diphosphate reductase alpha chain
MKDVHLLHKWNSIQRSFEVVDFTKILTKPTYADIDTMGALACSGGQCELI